MRSRGDAGRHERRPPLPGLSALPGHLFRSLSPRARRTLVALAVPVALAAALLALLAVPAGREDARRLDAEERAAQDAKRAERVRRAAVASRPRYGMLPGGPTAGRTAEGRDPSVRHVEGAVAADARERVRRGLLSGPILRVGCSSYPPSATPGADAVDRSGRARYECFAAIRDFAPTEGSKGGSLGHPFRALVDFRSGRFAYCKVAERAGEGGLRRGSGVSVPRACGG